ncbi:hypothetical protein [Aminobacter sp. AP02]|uniref:hypothetical protein n=1 Tax=Aminobacter sp. AP02 TaxID=2135737 RepID=UPI000D79AC73|nr:hypothetical protein [Aminobacter sp. AP02]PWK75436.1 hypothetical protein C8K44_1032 [Aminobacter sp. AP02]
MRKRERSLRDAGAAGWFPESRKAGPPSILVGVVAVILAEIILIRGPELLRSP